MQVVAFPQEGIFKAPGTDKMMIEAMEKGADVVGEFLIMMHQPMSILIWFFDCQTV